jgi:Cys-rich repeat protein
VSTRVAAVSGLALAVVLAGCGKLSGLDDLQEQTCADGCPDATADAGDASADAKDAADARDATDGDAIDASDGDALDAAEASETGDADAPETNPCEGVTCSAPPANECASATDLRVYATTGTCDHGACSYPSSLTTCPFGCSMGACAGDPCIGVTCANPTKSYCSDATHLTVYTLPGACSAGACVYQSHQEYCAFGCAGDVCNGDPCLGVTCNKPDASYCSGPSELSVFAPTGTCTAGACTYAKTTQYCAFGCDTGACKGDPCAGVSCATAPASYCKDTSTLRTYSAPGACAGGTCSFPYVDQHCPGGCAVGICRECATTTDCPSGKWCNGGACVACGDDLHCGSTCSDCSASGKVCNGGVSCVQCKVDSQCAAGSWCSANACVACNTAAKCGATCAPCSGTTPVCSGGACVCNATSCPSNQACGASGCAVCKSDTACGASCTSCAAPTKKCLDQTTTSKCVECLTSADCGSGKTCTGNACVTTCSGTIVDWDWSAGTAPTTTPAIAFGGTGANWSIGAATAGPSNGKTYLAVKPAGTYDVNLDNWARLPKIDLSTWASCKIKITAEVWIESEVGTYPYDGGSLQYTVDPASSTGWSIVDATSMLYDGTFSSLSCSSSCWLYGQKIWASINGVAKTATYTTAAALGNALSLRFTFHSDGSIVKSGLYVKRVLVEATP